VTALLRIAVVTLFPEAIAGQMRFGVTGRAVQDGLAEVTTCNPRDFAANAHRSVDDRPFGGGPGMVMMPGPLLAAIRDARRRLGDCHVALLSPQGRRLEQRDIEGLAARRALVLVAGRYEGIDERVVDAEVDSEWSIGDYVLSGGELPVLVLMDAMLRILPGALGNADSAAQDSFGNGLLDCPHYTRPEEHEGRRVPESWLSGKHERIGRWRLQQALGRTWQRRPDLLAGRRLSDEERELLNEYLTRTPGVPS